MTNLIAAFCKFANTLEKKKTVKLRVVEKRGTFFSPNDKPSAFHKVSAP
jgi:hypothetical protein